MLHSTALAEFAINEHIATNTATVLFMVSAFHCIASPLFAHVDLRNSMVLFRPESVGVQWLAMATPPVFRGGWTRTVARCRADRLRWSFCVSVDQAVLMLSMALA
jgi:hypothetical protein